MPDWIIPALSLSFVIMTFIGGLSWKQANQFSLMKSSIYDKLEKVEENILDKLEYHERHDDVRFADVQNNLDSRFNAVKNDIWMLRLRAAAKDQTLVTTDTPDVTR